ncbi:hypothetical protein NDU88_003569 [Pleurodeles waltl]|uniref:Reverse transcriptase domain-containing protein n=1 Tax=Pleurodeles waltl TaxID=8319 RepID=A0AAV7SGC2_PLEWA|nr:hypothetical protein NDU88_003569 [Pleurodeles waltl]
MDWKKKVAMYVDDLLVYTADPSLALPLLLEIAENLDRVSGYRVNPGKTEIMSWNQEMGTWQGKLELRFLGLIIMQDTEQLAERNQKKLLGDCRLQLVLQYQELRICVNIPVWRQCVDELEGCDWPDWTDPHNVPACADASSADPNVSPGSTNRVGQSPSQREPGLLKGQAARRRRRTVVVRRENGSSETAIAEEDEDGIGKSDGSEGPREPTVPSALLECGAGEKTRTAAVPIGGEESRLRGAEHYYPPRFRRSVAESGTWPWPGQG